MGFLHEKIYPLVPVWLQNVGVSAFGYFWKRRRFGGVFKEELKKFKEREAYTAKQLHDYQTQELRKLLIHAYETVAYYKELLDGLKISKEDLLKFEIEDLKKLPYLEKATLREYGTTKLVSSKREKGGEFFSSSGSTGKPTRILTSYKLHQTWSAAFEARYRNWAGVNRNMKRGMVGGRLIAPKSVEKGPFYRYNYFEKQVYFSAFHLSDKFVDDYASAFEKYEIDYMTGFAVPNYSLAKMFKRNGIVPPQMKAVITSSENLTPDMRELLSEVYRCRVYDSYSGVEMCGIISECEHGSLHVSPDAGILEVINVENGTGEMVFTGLLNYDQPLIRYRIGDMCTLADEGTKCACGREFQVLKSIDGRCEELFIAKDGSEVARIHAVFVGMENIEEGQIIQETVDHIRVKLVTLPEFEQANEEYLRKRIVDRVGDVKVDFEYVDEIPREKSGKFKAVISNVKRK